MQFKAKYVREQIQVPEILATSLFPSQKLSVIDLTVIAYVRVVVSFKSHCIPKSKGQGDKTCWKSKERHQAEQNQRRPRTNRVSSISMSINTISICSPTLPA